jgi:hypothetical protein
MMVTIMIMEFWNVALGTLVGRYQCLRGTHYLSLQGRRGEDRSSKFCYVGIYLPNYMMAHPR